MIYNASAQRMKREDERNQADVGAQARQADIAFPAQPLPAADKPAQPAQTAAESSAAPAGLFSPAPAAPDNKQKKAASLIGDLSHPDFMKPIRETAGAAAGKKPATAYVGYDFTKMLQEARGPGFPAPAERFPLWRGGPVGGRLEGADALPGSSGGNGRPQTLPYNPNNPAKPQQFPHLPGAGGNAPAHATVRLMDKQKKAASLVYDLSDPDFMNAIQKSAGLDAKTAAKNGGYSFTHMLQSELNTAGYPFVTKGPLKVDGVFGPKTQAAYAEFVENAPRLLGEGGAQATLSAARTPSADPTMRVSPDTEIIPVEIQNPVEPLEPPSDYIIRGARSKANTILSEMIAEQHSIIPWYRDLGTWNYNDYLYGGELKKQLKDLEIESSTTNATVELAKIAYAFATESNAPLTGYEIDALAHAYQIPITPAASQMIARVVNTGIAYVSPGGMSDMLPDDFIASIKGILQKRAMLEEQLAYLEDSGYSYLFTNMDNAHREDFIKDIRKRINQLERNPIQKFRDMKKNQYYNDEIIFMLERIVEMNTNYESNLTKLKQELSAIEKKYQ